ncbi:MAG: PD-(D/E)XK nuclease family protein [Campylobacterota bacterium]|nr:PD-(D/E)XK nuclease family protein [Campylobacterota bacterium]
MNLKYELYLSASSEAKDIYRKTLPKDGFFNCDAFSLGELIAKVKFSQTKIDDLIAQIIFKEALLNVVDGLKHFTFSKEKLFTETIKHLHSFYAKIKNNDVTLEEFAQGDKKDDIALIFNFYDKIKKDKNLIDKSDVISLVTLEQLNEVLEKYDSIIVDWQFFDSKINFISTDKERELFNGVVKNKTIEEKLVSPKKLNITLNKAFDFEDETVTAIKIVKDLVKNHNEDISTIAIVTSQINEYKYNIEKYLKEYALKGVVGKGKAFLNSPVYHEMLNLKDELSFKTYVFKTQCKLERLDDEFKQDYKLMVDCGLKVASKALSIVAKLSRDNFGIKVKFQEIFMLLSEDATYQSKDKSDTIAIVEHNQVLKSRYKHIIYMGIDSIHLPQQFKDNFLYNSQNAKKLHISNYYEDALYIYESLKLNTQNLHLVTARYAQKRELQISSVISDNFKTELEPYVISKNINSLNDLLDVKKQTTIGDKVKNFIISKQLKNEDEFHGIVGKSFKDNTDVGMTFSASRLNEFSDCPLKYYFKYILMASTPSEFNDEEFDSMQAGTLFHSVAEVFSNEYKKDDSLDIDSRVQSIYEDEYKKALPLRDGKVYETVFHKQKKQELQIAIDRFKLYVKDGELNSFHSAEEEFNFEMDGNKFTGIIDRIDVDESTNHITLIDYKTSKADKNTLSKDSKYQKLVERKEFQLPLYQFFVAQDEEYKKLLDSDSYLLTFTGDTKKETNARFGQTSSSYGDDKKKIYHFDNEEKQIYRDAIKKIADDITNGKFYFNDNEESCQWCNYKTVCGDGVK